MLQLRFHFHNAEATKADFGCAEVTHLGCRPPQRMSAFREISLQNFLRADMRRRNFLGLVGGAVASTPFAVHAQQPERPRRVGVLMAFAQSDAGWQRSMVIFREALESMGWAQGRNLQIEYRWGEADSGRIHVADLLSRAFRIERGSVSPA
jgi:hypothetical protein